MGYPNFLCIGARKAGTTWLHANLCKHPQLYLPPVKETHYLDHKPAGLLSRLFGRAAYLRNARAHFLHSLGALRHEGDVHNLRWALRYWIWPRSDKWYRSLFPSAEGLVCGEVCPGYARLDDRAVASVASRMPDLRIIYMLRDPIDCAWSSAGAHFAKALGPQGVLQAEPEDVERYFSKPNSLSHLDYAKNLANWRNHYPGEQIFISFFDELKSDPRQVLRRILEFLGVDNSDDAVLTDAGRKRGTQEGRSGTEMPTPYRRFLAGLYVDSLVELDDRLANEHTARWLAAARQAHEAC